MSSLKNQLLNIFNILCSNLSAVLRLVELRFLRKEVSIVSVATGAIGHFAMDVEIYRLRSIETNRRNLWIIPMGGYSNLALKSKFENSASICFFRPEASRLVNSLTIRVPFFSSMRLPATISAADIAVVDKSNNVLQFDSEEVHMLNIALSEFGVDSRLPIVLLCVRDSAYEEFTYKKTIDEISFRNSTLDSFELLIQHLASEGKQVVRMGKMMKKPIQQAQKGLFDYPFSEIVSDKMDLYLFSICEFVVSTDFGLDSLAYLFRKRVFKVNSLPLHSINIVKSQNYVLPKVLLEKNSHRILSIDEIIRRGVANAWTTSNYERAGVTFQDNEKSTILKSLKEFLTAESELTFKNYYTTDEMNQILRLMPEWYTAYRSPLISKFWPNLISSQSRESRDLGE